jgi:hypothetical protein
VPTSSAEIYDPAINSWTPAMPMIHARYGHAMAQLLDGRIFVARGIGNNSTFLASAEAYDWAQNARTPIAPMTLSRYGFPLQRLRDGSLVAVGGFSSDGVGSTNTSERYDPVSGTWSLLGQLNGIGGDRIAATVMPDGRLLATGGTDGQGSLAGAERLEVDPVFIDGFESLQ